MGAALFFRVNPEGGKKPWRGVEEREAFRSADSRSEQREYRPESGEGQPRLQMGTGSERASVAVGGRRNGRLGTLTLQRRLGNKQSR